MMQRAAVRLIVMSAATVVALAGCGAAAPPPGAAAVAETSSVLSAPVASTSTATPMTSELASTPSSPVPSRSTPKSRADEAFEHWTSQVPVYPGAVPWDAGSRSPALGTAQVEGFFTLTTSWSTTDDVRDVVTWFRSRVQLAGWSGSLKGPVQQWEIVFASTPADKDATTAASLSLLIGTGAQGTLISVVAAGAPIPDRSGRTRIDADRIVSAAVEIQPMGTVPEGYEPRTAKTVGVPPADRARLITLLNEAVVRPANTSSGFGFGYGFTVTFRADDGSAVTARFNTSLPGAGTQLTGDRGSEALSVGGEFFTLLDRICGVTRP